MFDTEILLYVQFSDNKPLFRDLRGDEVNIGNLEATEIESLCMNCHQNVSGRTWIAVFVYWTTQTMYVWFTNHQPCMLNIPGL